MIWKSNMRQYQKSLVKHFGFTRDFGFYGCAGVVHYSKKHNIRGRYDSTNFACNYAPQSATLTLSLIFVRSLRETNTEDNYSGDPHCTRCLPCMFCQQYHSATAQMVVMAFFNFRGEML